MWDGLSFSNPVGEVATGRIAAQSSASLARMRRNSLRNTVDPKNAMTVALIQQDCPKLQKGFGFETVVLAFDALGEDTLELPLLPADTAAAGAAGG